MFCDFFGLKHFSTKSFLLSSLFISISRLSSLTLFISSPLSSSSSSSLSSSLSSCLVLSSLSSCLVFSSLLSCLVLSCLVLSCLVFRVMMCVMLCCVVCRSACGVCGCGRGVCAVWCGTLENTVCRFKTPPCVHSKRPRVCQQHVHMSKSMCACFCHLQFLHQSQCSNLMNPNCF